MEVKVKKIVEIVSQVVVNADTYKVEANVRINNDAFVNAESGIVSDGNNITVATFNCYGTNNLNVNYQTNDADVIQEASKLIADYLEYCKANINSLTQLSE